MAPVVDPFLTDYSSDECLAEISEAFDRMGETDLKGIVRICYSNRIGRPDVPIPLQIGCLAKSRSFVQPL